MQSARRSAALCRNRASSTAARVAQVVCKGFRAHVRDAQKERRERGLDLSRSPLFLAEAHGSYRAISGGEIAEAWSPHCLAGSCSHGCREGHLLPAKALLDLTGCPTESIDCDERGTWHPSLYPLYSGGFWRPGFDPQELWERLVDFKARGRLVGSPGNSLRCRPKAFQWAVPLREIPSCGRQ